MRNHLRSPFPGHRLVALGAVLSACSPAPMPSANVQGNAPATAGGASTATPSATPSPPPRSLTIPVEDYFDFDSTNRTVVSALAVDAEASHAFLGVRVSGVPSAKALGVLTRAGTSFSHVARYLPLSDRETDPGATFVVTDLVVRGTRLYALWNDNVGSALSTYELGPSGEPLPASLTFSPLGPFGGGASGRLALPRKPSDRFAYLTSNYTPELAVLELDARGLPVPSRADAPNPRVVDLGHGPLTSVATSSDGTRLLVGAGADTLLDVALHPASHPTPALRGAPRDWKARVPRASSAAPCPENLAADGKRPATCKDAPYTFLSTGRHLFRTYGGSVDLRGRVPLERLELTADGARPPVALGVASYALALDPEPRPGAPRGVLWSADGRRVAAVDGRPVLQGVDLTPRDPETGQPLAGLGAGQVVGRGRAVSHLAVASKTGTVVAFTEPTDEPSNHGDVASGYALRFTVTALDNPHARFPTWPTKLQIVDTSANMEGRDGGRSDTTLTALGKPSDWCSLDFALGGKGARSERVLTLLFGAAPLDLVGDNTQLAPDLARSPSWSVHIDVGHKEKDGSYTVVRSMDEGPIYGRSTTFFAPGYDASVFDVTKFETLTETSRRWLRLSQSTRASARPRRIGASCQAMLSHGGKELVENVAQTLANVGCNELTSDYTQHLPKKWVFDQFARVGVDRAGVKYIGGTLDSTKDFLSGDHQADDAAWIDREFREDSPGSLFQRQGAPISAMRTLLLDDEPAWPLAPKRPFIAGFPKHAASRASFRAWVAKHASGSHGGSGWATANDALPVPALGASATPQGRRRYYWTVRYFQTAAATRMLEFKDRIWGGLQKTPACAEPARCDYSVGMNWNNSPTYRAGVWTYDTGESEVGAYDWFETMRVQAARPGGERGTSAPRSFTPWIDTKFSDAMSQLAAFRADAIGSASALPNMLPGATPAPLTRFGAHITVGVGAPMRDGLSYKVLANVARGARTVEYWAFGPKWIMPADGWSDYPAGYPEVARANTRLGWADTLLAEGERPRGRVAIQAEGVSALWSNGTAAHLLEPTFLHAALTHAGYPVELVDDESIARGVLAKHFDVLFLTQLHTSERAQDAIAKWVEEGGGTLVATPAAGARSEFDEPTRRLDGTLGARSRTEAPTVLPAIVPGTGGYERMGTLTPEPGVGTEASKIGAAYVLRPVCEKKPCRQVPIVSTADVLARMGAEPAITRKRWPSGGQAYLYSFYPGLQHWLSAEARNAAALPTGYRSEAREWAALAVRSLEPSRPPGALRPVRTSVPGVEAVSVRSKKGTALVLFNWTGAPLPGGTVTLTVVDPERFAFALRDDRTAVPLKSVHEGVELTLPLDTVEIVRLCRNNADPDCR